MTPEEDMLLTTFGPCAACDGPRRVAGPVLHPSGARHYTLRCAAECADSEPVYFTMFQATAPEGEETDGEVDNPFSQLASGAIQLHEWYSSMREAGFTQEEAIAIVVGVIVSS